MQPSEDVEATIHRLSTYKVDESFSALSIQPQDELGVLLILKAFRKQHLNVQGVHGCIILAPDGKVLKSTCDVSSTRNGSLGGVI